MLLKNDRGSALIMVLLVLTVGALIGVALLTVGVNEDLQVSAEEKTIQAYYVARSAADALAAHIIEEALELASDSSYPFNLSDFEDLINDHSEPIEFAGGEAVVTMTVVGDTVEIESSSTYMDNFSGHAVVVLDQRLYFDHLIWSENPLDDPNPTMEVYDGSGTGEDLEIASNGAIDNSPDKVDGDPSVLLPDQTESYPEPEEPGVPNADPLVFDYMQNNPHDVFVIAASEEYGTVDIRNGELHFDTSGGDLDVVFDTAEFKGNIVVIGTNSVNIYIRTLLDIQTPISVNDDPEKLTFNLFAGSKMEMSANGSIYGYIKGPSATVEFGSAQTDFYGAVVCGKLITSSTPDITYIPPSDAYNEEEKLLERSLWKD